MPEEAPPRRVAAVQAELQYQPAEIAGRWVRISAGSDSTGPGVLPCCMSAVPDRTEWLLVVVHGALRDAGHYLAHAQAAAGQDASRTLIVAPQFLADVDLRPPADGGGPDGGDPDGGTAPQPGTLYWDAEGWKGGEPALGTARLSSFAVMDALLEQLTVAGPGPGPGGASAGRPPKVVIFGNSAGGQYVNRYAAVGRGPERLAGRGIAVRFVISNPSTYLYFTEDRPGPGGSGVNRWRYGFDGAPAYVEGDGRENLRRYLARDVTIVLGREDSDGASLLLETGAAAMAQGANRYERGVSYHAYVSELARREGLEARHRLIELEGVGHSAADVMAAEPVREILFG
jgi:hypothetical protein